MVYRPATSGLKSPLPKPDKTTIPSRPYGPALYRSLPLNAPRMPEWSASRSLKKWFKTEASKQVRE